MLHISIIFFLQTDTYIDELVEIFLKLSVKTVQVHLIIGTTLVKYLGLTLANFTVQVVIENEWNILECLFKKLDPKIHRC